MDTSSSVDARIALRKATIGDLPAVIRHRHAMFAEMGYSEESLLAMDDAALLYFARAFENHSYHHWFIDVQDRIAAGAAVSLNSFYPGPRDPRPQRAWLLNVYTEPECRNQGMARRLVETAIAWCRVHGVRILYLHASDFGRPLYEELGFISSNEMQLDLTR